MPRKTKGSLASAEFWKTLKEIFNPPKVKKAKKIIRKIGKK